MTDTTEQREEKSIIEYLDEIISACEGKKVPMSMLDGLCRAKAELQKREWISVIDQAPEIGQAVLVVHVKDGFMFTETWDELREAPLLFSTMTVPSGVGWEDHDFDEISHWMPLPSPPTGSTNE